MSGIGEFNGQTRVTGFNLSGDDILSYTPVELLTRLDRLPGAPECCFSVALAGPDTKLCGIAQSRMHTNEPVPVLLSGLTPARLPDFVAAGDFLKLAASGTWEVAETGIAQVISPPEPDSDFGLIILRGISPSAGPELMVLTQVPPGGFGVGAGRAVCAVNPDGTLVLADTESPVNLPVLL